MTLLIVLGLLAQLPAALPGAALSGSVFEDGSRAPIAGAEVTLLPSRPTVGPSAPEDHLSMTTDREGRYRFADVQPGRYRILVRKAGFVRPLSPPPEVTIALGDRRADVNVSLQRGGVITGAVFDENGQPLAEMRVMAMQKRAPSNADAPVPRASFVSRDGVNTNDLGEFRLHSLMPGEYYVEAAPDFGSGRSSVGRTHTTIPTYFPGTPDAGGASQLSVGPGQVVGNVNIRMISAPAFRVSGVVRDEAGRPVVNAMVRVIMDKPDSGVSAMAGRHQRRTSATGAFSMGNIISGTYTLLAVPPVVIARAPSATTRSFEGRVISSGMTMGDGNGSNLVTTETTNGTTTRYSDDTATRVPITVGDANVSDLEVIVRTP